MTSKPAAWHHMPLDEYEQLRADLDGLMQESQSSREAMDRARFKIDELRAEIERLRADATRMDIAIQNVWAVIDNLDNAFVSPTSDQRDVLDALRLALRKA